ncbi:HAD-IIIC family phosphatase [Ferruginibacter sp.]
MNYNVLIKNLKKDFSSLKKIKIAVLGDSATQMLVKALRAYGYERGYDFTIFEADYDQIERQVFDPGSELFEFKPDYVIIYYSSKKLIKKFYNLPTEQKGGFADKKINDIASIYEAVNSSLKCKTILFNFTEINDSVFGNFANKTTHSFTYQVRKINFELMGLAQRYKNLFINDISALSAKYGSDFSNDPKMFINADIHTSLDFLPILAKNITEIILSIAGSFKKCVILDLDNTLWGGIIGDDGYENIQVGDLGIGKAFTELQRWIKQLKQRGIILAVCSKNFEHVAQEAFEKNPDMILKLDDIAVFVANWDNKADNIRHIQSILNIGFDSMVFFDDNPFERNIVRENIPDITVPELPEDPAEYLPYLQSLNLFETASYTEEDEQRTQQYKEEAKRTEVQKQFANEDEFLQSLNMVSAVKPFDKFNTPRVAQLTQRSNQFNLRTVRYTENEVQEVGNSAGHFPLSFTLEDKFGDNGLISVVILKKDTAEKLFVDTWIMSCRVLKRGMENFVLNNVMEVAAKNGFKEVVGEYIATAKNGMVKEHYQRLGFTTDPANENRFSLKVADYKNLKTFINTK